MHSVHRSHRCTARAAGTHAGEFELLVGPLLDAMEKSLEERLAAAGIDAASSVDVS